MIFLFKSSIVEGRQRYFLDCIAILSEIETYFTNVEGNKQCLSNGLESLDY